MPRIGAEEERRKALIHAAIEMIGEQGSLDVPVKEIAKQAGMSPALAFHYFGGKDEIILATMRHLLKAFSDNVVEGLENASSPTQRIEAIIAASFSEEQFDRRTVAAWLVFYLRAYSVGEAARLLTIYTRRLRSNLVHGLVGLMPRPQAERTADGLSALIDGLYIRHGLSKHGSHAEDAKTHCRTFVSNSIRASISGDH